MDAGWLQPVLDWINLHPGWAGLALFFATALESLLIVGLFVPGVFILFAAGALVAAGALDLWPTLLWAAAGAIVGDGVSYAIGRHYHDRLYALWPLRLYPALLDRGDAFFRRHGGKSVVLGRFLGAIRPIAPAVAGAAGMRPLYFFAIDVTSALVWAPFYILPGVVFGASLGLAAQVASRLVVLLVLVLALVWLVVWLTRTAFSSLQDPVEKLILRLLDWSQRHRRLGHLGRSLADPEQPETPGLALLALLLLAAGWVCFALVWGLGPDKHPLRLDAVVYHLFQGLRTPWSDLAAGAVAQLGDWQVYSPLAVAVLVGLLSARRFRAALHWVAAIAFGAALAGGLHLLLALPQPVDFYYHESITGAFAGGQIILSTVIYGFLPVILTTGRLRRRRWPYYGCAGTLIALIAVARLYLGAQWFSEAAIGAAVALAWVVLLGLAYRRHRARAVPVAPLLVLMATTLALAAATQWTLTLPAFLARFQPTRQVLTMSPGAWAGRSFAALPAYRADLEGHRQNPMNLQWAGSLPHIRAALTAAGWQPPPPFTAATVLRWLSASATIDTRPVLPQVHDGRSAALVMVRPLKADDEQLILRLWPTEWRLGILVGAPLWIGYVAHQHVLDLLSIGYVPANEVDFSQPMAALRDALPAAVIQIAEHPRAQPVPPAVRWDGRVLLMTSPTDLWPAFSPRVASLRIPSSRIPGPRAATADAAGRAGRAPAPP